MLRAVIVDDELKAIQRLSWELTNFSKDIEVIKTFTDPFKALEFLKDYTPDCLFLDIQMPTMDGFQFLDKLDNRDIAVVITTAYDEYAIKALKRFVAAGDSGRWRSKINVAPKTGKKVAIVGSGPAGLTAGWFLRKLGHSVTVFETLGQAGGMLRLGIPKYRLPRKVLNQEIKEIEALGVKLKLNTRIKSIDRLFRQGFRAVLRLEIAQAGRDLVQRLLPANPLEGPRPPGPDAAQGVEEPVGRAPCPALRAPSRTGDQPRPFDRVRPAGWGVDAHHLSVAHVGHQLAAAAAVQGAGERDRSLSLSPGHRRISPSRVESG